MGTPEISHPAGQELEPNQIAKADDAQRGGPEVGINGGAHIQVEWGRNDLERHALDVATDDRPFYLLGGGEWDNTWSWATPLIGSILSSSPSMRTQASEEDINALWTCMQDVAAQGPFPDQPQRVEITVLRY